MTTHGGSAPRLLWPGKEACVHLAHAPSVVLPVPMPEASVNFAHTRNLIVEGDNLDGLKWLLQHERGQIKVIYIDPPYNRATQLMYADNHGSAWLNMIYPRLLLAHRLLRDDGLMFISIDDCEVHHLRLAMDEIFGAEQFVAVIAVRSNKRGQTYQAIARAHEYLLVYARGPRPTMLELQKDVALPYQDARGPYDLWELRNRNPRFGQHNRPNLYFPIHVAPTTRDASGLARVALQASTVFCHPVLPQNRAGVPGCWRWGAAKIAALDLGVHQDLPDLVARQRRDGGWNIYEKSRKGTTKAKSWWDETTMISEQGTRQLGALGLAGAFDHPKPLALMRKILDISVQPGDTVLDFFAGSGSTAHAALLPDAAVHPRFILIQQAEPLQHPQFAHIAALTRERVRRVLATLPDATADQDRGFRAYRLAPPP